MTLKIKNGGTVLVSCPVTVNIFGHTIEAVIANDGSAAAQINHIAEHNRKGNVAFGTSALNSANELTLDVVLQADSAAEINDDEHFIVKHLTVELLS